MDSNIHPDVLHFVSKVCSHEWHHEDIMSNYYLQFIEDGIVDYEIGGSQFQAGKGEVVFLRPGNVRKATTTGMTCTVIAFLLPEKETVDLPMLFSLGSFDEFKFYFQDLKYEWLQRNPGYAMKSQAILLMILHKLIYERARGRKNRHVELIKQYIMNNYTQRLTLGMIADAVGLSPVYCGALFKKTENCTVSEFVTQIRINRAIALLEIDECSITEVAEATGFPDLYSFSNTFKKVVGVAPSIYKKGMWCAKKGVFP